MVKEWLPFYYSSSDVYEMAATLSLEQERGLSTGTSYQLRDGAVLESKCSLTLKEFLTAQETICGSSHNQHCLRCLTLLKACSKLLADGISALAPLWRYATSNSDYKSDKVKRMFLQIPVALISSGGSSGEDQVYVVPKTDRETYELLIKKLQEADKREAPVDHTELLKDLVSIAENEAERERLKYAATALCNASTRGAKKYLGVSLREGRRAEKVVQAVQDMKELKESNEEMKAVEIEAKFGNRSEDADCDREVNEWVPKEDLRRINSKYRMRLKALSQKYRIRRKSTKNVNNMVAKFPDIGKVMESYAYKCDVGADRWRHVTYATFGGEKKCEKRLTFEKLRQHLITIYGRHFSIGTVAQLCAPRNERHRSSKRYHKAAKLRYQRAWKGYNNKLNPDDAEEEGEFHSHGP